MAKKSTSSATRTNAANSVHIRGVPVVIMVDILRGAVAAGFSQPQPAAS